MVRRKQDGQQIRRKSLGLLSNVRSMDYNIYERTSLLVPRIAECNGRHPQHARECHVREPYSAFQLPEVHDKLIAFSTKSCQQFAGGYLFHHSEPYH